MNILSLFTHFYVVPNLYDWHFPVKHKKEMFGRMWTKKMNQKRSFKWSFLKLYESFLWITDQIFCPPNLLFLRIFNLAYHDT